MEDYDFSKLTDEQKDHWLECESTVSRCDRCYKIEKLLGNKNKVLPNS